MDQSSCSPPPRARSPAALGRALPSLANCRAALQAVVAKCDSNMATPGLVWPLLANWWVWGCL